MRMNMEMSKLIHIPKAFLSPVIDFGGFLDKSFTSHEMF